MNVIGSEQLKLFFSLLKIHYKEGKKKIRREKLDVFRHEHRAQKKLKSRTRYIDS